MKFVLLLSLLVPSFANALDFSIGAGGSVYTTVMDGFWYDQALPHTLTGFGNPDQPFTPSWRVSVAGDISEVWKWRAAYVAPGVIHSDAIAVVPDASYDNKNHVCLVHPCIPLYRFVGSGTANGVALTGEYHEHKIAAGFGVYLFSLRFRMDTYGYAPGGTGGANHGHYETSGTVHIGPTTNLCWRRGRSEVRLDYFLTCVNNRCKSEIIPQPIWRSFHVFTYNWRF